MTNSRAKGCRGELELSHYLTDRGFPARRGQQYAGGTDSPDVVCPSLPAIHWEAKRVERLRLHEAMLQAIDEAGDKVPVVAHRRNRGEWLAVLRLDDLLRLMEATE